jgi:hypothetical protein
MRRKVTLRVTVDLAPVPEQPFERGLQQILAGVPASG